MAVDTRDKRSSAIGTGRPWLVRLADPAGSIAQDDRQHVTFSYSGILAAALVVFVLPGRAADALLGDSAAAACLGDAATAACLGDGAVSEVTE